jgi:erythronate-4-phosphate dehydrogenase
LIKIASDSQIPNIQQKLSEFFADEYSLEYFVYDELTSNDLKNVDALLVRSTIQVGKKLCDHSSIKFVGSATAGINHLDTEYLDAQNISWSHAPGCNAFSVIHYVMAALGELIQEGLFSVRQSIGIIGYGNIGKRLYQLLSALNIEVYAYDPLLKHSHLVTMEKVLACDLITIHVPYSTEGVYPTSQLINQSHRSFLKDKILINTSRGGVVCEKLVTESNNLIYVADVWVDEPTPSITAIKNSFIATPHIAGYSIEGKMNGTGVIASECAKAFNCLKDSGSSNNQLMNWPHGLENIVRDMHSYGFPLAMFNSELDLSAISNAFKDISTHTLADGFKDLRVKHSPRHDFNAYSYQDIVGLDESINLDFFNSLRSLK